MDLTFKAGAGLVVARIFGKRLFFIQYVNNTPVIISIDKVKFPLEGMLKRFPDLQGKSYDEMRTITAERIKEHLDKMTTEKEVEDYVAEELKSIGCQLIMKSKPGFRPVFYVEGKEIGVNAKWTY